MYCCNCKMCLMFGIVGIICTIIQSVIICAVALTVLSLVCKRICIEPMHHPDGDYCWALTKNGKPCKWFREDKYR